MKIIITGSLGFIGSNFLLKLVEKKYHVFSIDKHSYASNTNLLKKIKNKKFKHYKLDIGDLNKLEKIILKINPDLIINFAAESHVDNSILSPKKFIKSNIVGTYNLLEISKKINKKKNIKFIQISTDEVYGDLDLLSRKKFNESSPMKPNSPYSASKASAEMLVRAWSKTFNLPTIIIRSSNNFGPYQNNEKFIPTIISNLINKKKIPVYGKGKNIRNWIYVEDNVDAIFKIIKKGKIGEVYNIAGNIEISNIKLVKIIEKILVNKFKYKFKDKYVFEFVKDRPGHDKKYSMEFNKLKSLGWHPKVKFKDGLFKTISWFLNDK